jgi:transketolase
LRDAFVEALTHAATEAPNLLLVTGDLGYKVLDKFRDAHPEKFINSGVAEQSMLGMAAGLASEGFRVFVYSIGNFPTLRALEQIRNDVCYMNRSVVVVSVGSGYSYGAQGYTHHALEDLAALRSLPNLSVMSPTDPLEVSVLTHQLALNDGPTYLRLGRGGEVNINVSTPLLVPGRLNWITRGQDGTLLFTGSIANNVKSASVRLSTYGLDVGLVSAPYLNTVCDEEFIELAKRGPILVVEEHAITGGFGSYVLERLNGLGIRAFVSIMGAERANLSLIGTQDFLREKNGIGVEAIAERFLMLLHKSD